MSTADLTRTWCEIEVLVDSIAPFLQEVVSGNGSNYQQFSSEIRNRLQKVVHLSRRARQISSDVQRLTSAKATQRMVHQQVRPPPQPQSRQVVMPSAAPSPNHAQQFQLNSISVPKQAVLQSNVQYRVVDGKVQAFVNQPSQSTQPPGNWHPHTVVMDQFGKKVAVRAIPMGGGGGGAGPPQKKQAVVYDLTEADIRNAANPPNRVVSKPMNSMGPMSLGKVPNPQHSPLVPDQQKDSTSGGPTKPAM